MAITTAPRDPILEPTVPSGAELSTSPQTFATHRTANAAVGKGSLGAKRRSSAIGFGRRSFLLRRRHEQFLPVDIQQWIWHASKRVSDGVELAGLEPATSWVRKPSRPRAQAPSGGRGSGGGHGLS